MMALPPLFIIFQRLWRHIAFWVLRCGWVDDWLSQLLQAH
jgi:hypothetical protein